MDQISRLRFKNVAERLLVFCDAAENDGDRAVLLRIGIVALNKLRVHSNADSTLGYEVRELTKKVDRCIDRTQFLGLWDDAIDLVGAYHEALAA